MDAEAKGKDASEIPHKPWEWMDSQVRTTRLAELRIALKQTTCSLVLSLSRPALLVATEAPVIAASLLQ